MGNVERVLQDVIARQGGSTAVKCRDLAQLMATFVQPPMQFSTSDKGQHVALTNYNRTAELLDFNSWNVSVRVGSWMRRDESRTVQMQIPASSDINIMIISPEYDFSMTQGENMDARPQRTKPIATVDDVRRSSMSEHKTCPDPYLSRRRYSCPSRNTKDRLITCAFRTCPRTGVLRVHYRNLG